MQTVVVYDSEYGNTEQIAQAIAKGLAAKGEVRVARVGSITPAEFQGAGLVVIGAPTQGGRASKGMQPFLDSIPTDALKGIKVAAFDTRMTTKFVKLFGYAAGRIAGVMKDKGGTLTVPAEGFFVTTGKGPLKEGELERAEEWGKKLSEA